MLIYMPVSHRTIRYDISISRWIHSVFPRDEGRKLIGIHPSHTDSFTNMTSCFGSCANNGKGALNTDPLTRSELCHRSKGNLSDLDTNPIPPAMTSSANRSPSIRIYLARRPIAVPQYEYTSPVDQSRSLNTNIPRPPTNRGPSIRIYLAHRPIAVPQYEYTSPADQSRSLDTNIPHPPINCSPSIRMLHRAATQRGWRSETAVDSSDGNVTCAWLQQID